MKIGAIRKKILGEYGKDISNERIRRYEQWGLIKPTRDKAGFRCYTNKDYIELVKIVLSIDIGIPLEVLRDKDTAMRDSLLRKKMTTIKDLCTLYWGSNNV